MDFSTSDETEIEGDYSTRMEEFLNDGDVSSEFREHDDEDEEDEEEEAFIYTGMDADDVPIGYKAQLRDVLGADHEDESEAEVEKSLIIEQPSDDEPLVS